MEVLRAQGIEAEPLDFWSRDDSFDILHVWGMTVTHQSLVRIAKQHGKKVVMTPLLAYLDLKIFLNHIRSLITGYDRMLIDLVRHVDLLLVVNELQAETAIRLYRISPDKVKIVPTILDVSFFEPSEELPYDDFSNYVVCAGNILPRKNQVRLARAAIAVGCPTIFVGNIIGGDESYTKEFAQLVESSPLLRWHKWVSWHDLNRLFRNSVGVVLPSFEETQPAAGLEAAAMGKPLLLGNRAYAKQRYFRNALLKDPSSESAIGNGLRQLRENPSAYVPPRDIIAECHPDHIGLNLRGILGNLVYGG